MAKARIGSLELDYVVEGEGEPLVLIMGFSAQWPMWPDELVQRLVRDGFQVIRFDNRDAGASSKLDHLGVPDLRRALARSAAGLAIDAPYKIADMAGDVAGLLDHLSLERAHVVGASMGGMIAQSFAIRHPERTRSLVSIMSTPGGRRNLVGHPRALSALLRKPARTRDAHADGFVQLFSKLRGTGFPFEPESLREMGQLCWDRGVSPAGAARQFAAIVADGKSRYAGLRRLKVPTLVVHGTEDPLLPERAGRATAALIPGARYLPVDGMGHEFPAAVMPLLAGAITSLRQTIR